MRLAEEGLDDRRSAAEAGGAGAARRAKGLADAHFPRAALHRVGHHPVQAASSPDRHVVGHAHHRDVTVELPAAFTLEKMAVLGPTPLDGPIGSSGWPVARSSQASTAVTEQESGGPGTGSFRASHSALCLRGPLRRLQRRWRPGSRVSAKCTMVVDAEGGADEILAHDPVVVSVQPRPSRPEGASMARFRMIAIPTDLADTVRTTLVSPRYGHPAHVEVARGHGPCRLCLQTFKVGIERRILFTLDPFAGVERYPLPGPVFIHENACVRYAEDGGFPEGLRAHALTLDAYGRGRLFRTQERVNDEEVEPALERLFARTDVDYVHVLDTDAGCFDLRIERWETVKDATLTKSTEAWTGR